MKKEHPNFTSYRFRSYGPIAYCFLQKIGKPRGFRIRRVVWGEGPRRGQEGDVGRMRIVLFSFSKD